MVKRLRVLALSVVIGVSTLSCSAEGPPPEPRTYPRLVATPDMKAVVLARIDREPYLTLLDRIYEDAEMEFEEDPPGEWHAGTHEHNADIAQANAFLAWLLDDEAAAMRAREALSRIDPDFENNNDWDVNIKMLHCLGGWTHAWDLLKATPWFPDDEAALAEERITEINDGLYERFIVNNTTRRYLLGTTQNNHPIRTAVAIGVVALCFPDHPKATEWATWVFSELDYLWGPTGQYVQPDGGVSEGPFYAEFAWAPSVMLFANASNAFAEPPTYLRDCRNRTDVDPWTGHGCVEGESFTWENPLLDPESLFWRAADWELGLRLPWGQRPPFEDANMNPFNGSALLTGFGGDGMYRWDWEENRDRPLHTDWGANLRLHHLLYFDDAVEATEPSFLSRVQTEAGNAVFRSDWSDDARWMLLLAENGSVRKTVHDHVDGTSFSVAAYGEYLLLDPGYYKTNDLALPITSAPQAHNLILIDGEAQPPKGLLTEFGDTDAFLRHSTLGAVVEYVEAHQDYQDATIERSVAFVDGRYFVVNDSVSTLLTEAREHRWRLNGYAGRDEGGMFDLRASGALWERPLAGIEVQVAATVSSGATADPVTDLACVEPPFVAHQAPHVHKFDLSRTLAHHGVMDAVIDAPAPGFLAVLAPYRVGDMAGTADGPLATTDLRPAMGAASRGVAAWEVTLADATDVAVQRAPDAPTSFTLGDGTTVETDARFVLFRVLGPRTFTLMARGSYLRVNGMDRLTGVGDPVFLLEE